MMLNTIVTGDAARPPLVIAHGLYGSARNWGVIAKRLSDVRQVIAVDMRNHGDSPHDPDHSYAALARDLADVIDVHGGRADVLGHSMGGKAAMVMALTHPEKVERLIVADIAPVAYGHSQIQYVEAMKRMDLSGLTRRSEAEPRLAQDVDDPALRAFFLQSLMLGEEGNRWKYNLDALADQMPQIMGFPDLPGQFDREVVFLRGATSDYVSGDGITRAQGLFPRARFEKVANAGHWLHAENPRGFEAAMREALG